jgi:hypothetical protein
MKLRLKVTYIDAPVGVVVFHRADSPTSLGFVYNGLPRRLAERYRMGDHVDAEIQVPGLYPTSPE